MAGTSALAGLRVIDFSNLRTGAQVSQSLADFGADVVHVEPPGGSDLRREAAWAMWGRGKRSLQLDLRAAADLELARNLATGADVVIETFRPGVADRMGLGYEVLSGDNPRLVYASITGFGSQGPLADLQGYEGIVFAKLGVLWHVKGMSARGGPAFPSGAYASYPTSQLALQGILAALYERETSGAGQRVETSMIQGLTVHDTLQWFLRVLTTRYPDGLAQMPMEVGSVPSGGLSFRVLIAQSADGRWLQFSQTAARLFRAMIKLFDLEWMFDDPKFRTLPEFEDVETRVEFWEILLNKVRAKTAAEWHAEFERHPDVWAELFRKGSELLDHPQMVWNKMVAELDDPVLGKVRMPGPLAHLSVTPAHPVRPAPKLGQHDAALRAEAAAPKTPAIAKAAPKGRLPLAGITIIELSTYYAAPYAATLLGELGARVIKLEDPAGDPHRFMLPFPELAAIKALFGKECVAVDVGKPQGREIAHRIIGKADMVLQSFRAGVAERLGLDHASLLKIDPNLIYVNAPGYGRDGPYGRRPAFAPTIGAAAGLAWRNVGATVPEDAGLPLERIKPHAMQLATAVMAAGHSDALSAVSTASAMMLGLLARKRGAGGQEVFTTMLSSTAHALSEVMVDYAGRPDAPTADPGLHGFSALYRLYQAAGEADWVFLAAPKQREWERLCSVLDEGDPLANDPRYSTVQARRENDEALTETLAAIFRTRLGAEWESRMRAADVACVVAAKGPVEANYHDEGSIGRQLDMVTTCHHPLFDELPRIKPLLQFSRSATTTGDAGLIGQHTEAVLREFGYSAGEIAAMEAEKIISLG